MDATGFDRLARALGAALPRRGAVGGLLAGALAPLLGAAGGDATRRRGHGEGRAVSAQRKKRKRKKKTPPCVPSCDRRVCGPDGCGGSCGACEAPTTCDGQGRCVGCQTAEECAEIPCRAKACAAGVCRYEATADGTRCAGTRVCCGGTCTDTRADDANCDGCGQACGPGRTCFAGQCIFACDVCASGCEFETLQSAVDAASPGMTITLCPGTYPGSVSIAKTLTVRGLGDDPSDTVFTNPTGPILTVDSGADVVVRNLSVSGVASGTRAAIVNFGDLTLRMVRVVDNTPTASAGGIENSANLTLIDSVVSNNAAVNGAGIYPLAGGITRLTRSRVEGNRAIVGAGIYNNSSTVILSDGSAVTGNTASAAPPAGGGIYNIGPFASVSVDATSSVSDNTPDDCVNLFGATGCTA